VRLSLIPCITLSCDSFLRLFSNEQETWGGVCLDTAAKKLHVERRRIYDIVNVLESVEIVARRAKNKYAWFGMTRLPQAIERLRTATASELNQEPAERQAAEVGRALELNQQPAERQAAEAGRDAHAFSTVTESAKMVSSEDAKLDAAEPQQVSIGDATGTSLSSCAAELPSSADSPSVKPSVTDVIAPNTSTVGITGTALARVDAEHLVTSDNKNPPGSESQTLAAGAKDLGNLGNNESAINALPPPARLDIGSVGAAEETKMDAGSTEDEAGVDKITPADVGKLLGRPHPDFELITQEDQAKMTEEEKEQLHMYRLRRFLELYRQQKASRKEKSLGVLSQKFVQLFLNSEHGVVSLEPAARKLLEEDTFNDEGQLKTKIRRLYDIANILCSLNLVLYSFIYLTHLPCFDSFSRLRRHLPRNSTENLLSNGSTIRQNQTTDSAMWGLKPCENHSPQSKPHQSLRRNPRSQNP
jgi:hypothetical protein